MTLESSYVSVGPRKAVPCIESSKDRSNVPGSASAPSFAADKVAPVV